MNRGAVVLAALLAAGCGDDGGTNADGPGAADGPGTPDGPTGPPDAARCGDGYVEGDEVCDGGSAACGELGPAFSGGSAPCRADCSGWDPAACTLAMPAAWEVVQPGTRDPRWADARCNDGTPFAFYVRPRPDSHTWIFWLEGGAYCDDVSAPCSARPAGLTTTIGDPDRALRPSAIGGLTSTDPVLNPDFAAANVVYAHYCSSDFWAGATTEPRPSSGDPVNGWTFAGHRNVEAMLGSLVAAYGLDDGKPDLRVLFGGGSAGAFGAHLNASRVEAVLPGAAAAGRLLLLVDAGWWFEWDDPSYRIGAATTNDRDVCGRMRDFWAATFDPQCESEVTDPVDCLFGVGWYPRVRGRLPVLVLQSRQDEAFAIATHGIPRDSATLDTWRTLVETSLTSVDWLFSGAEPYHTLADRDPGALVGPPGSSLAEVVGRFFAGGAPERVLFPVVAPEVWLNRAATQADPTTASPIRFDAQFSEGVTGLTEADLSFTGSTVGGALSATLTDLGGGAHWAISVTGMTGSGLVVVSIPALVASDVDGHANAASSSSDNAVMFGP